MVVINNVSQNKKRKYCTGQNNAIVIVIVKVKINLKNKLIIIELNFSLFE